MVHILKGWQNQQIFNLLRIGFLQYIEGFMFIYNILEVLVFKILKGSIPIYVYKQTWKFSYLYVHMHIWKVTPISIIVSFG